MRRNGFPSIASVISVLLLTLLLAACARQGTDSDASAEWIEQGASLLANAATGIFSGGIKETEWDLESAEIRVDDERFPDWARGEFEVCVYWSAVYVGKGFRMMRERGESLWYDQPGRAWGWILVSEGRVHVLELAYQYDEEGSEIVKHVEAWEAPDSELPEVESTDSD